MTKMPRKRKVPLKSIAEDAIPENVNKSIRRSENRTLTTTISNGPMFNIMNNVQLSETFHPKFIKELRQLYDQMDHDAFMFTFIKMIKSAMASEETNEFGNTTLLFCAKYIASYSKDDTHIIIKEIFQWITETISTNPHIRFRLCQFVNFILNALGVEAALEDCICDSIMSYMINRLRDISPNVRVQAILALQRLQIPDNPDDIIVKTYQFHLSSDPSPKVRQAVITSMGRNYNTIPYILERLWDIDEKVRKHTYLNMSSYPVKTYKVSQRLTFLEQGLNDRSEMVRKVVVSVMLPQWLESYNRNYISLISALKLDANEAEMERFRKITKVALKEIFKRGQGEIEQFIECLPLEDDESSEFRKCIIFEKLTIENSLYLCSLVEFLHNELEDDIDLVLPDLSTFCNYILKYCESQNFGVVEDKWKKMEYQYILLTLVEIVCKFDLGDEIGRENLKVLIQKLLTTCELEDGAIEKIVKCTENLIEPLEDRLHFFVDIIKTISDSSVLKVNDFINDRTLIESLLEKHPDKNLKLQLSSLRVKILDLEEQERNLVQKKEYAKAQEIADEKSTCSEEYMNLLKPLLAEDTDEASLEKRKNLSLAIQSKKNTKEDIIKCLQIAFYMVVSKKVRALTPLVSELYKEFIRRHIESNQIVIRNWALKCGTAYSMLYDQLAKDVYNELYAQFFKNQNINIWNTSIDCLFELLDRYGFEKFEDVDKQNKSKKPGRQLYNTLESLDVDEENVGAAVPGRGVDVIFMMSHMLDTCDHIAIIKAITYGLCRLVLHGHIKNDDIMEKLLLKYFNPATDIEVNQTLGVFFNNLIQRKKQKYLQPCLLPTISTILSAPYDSPLHEIKPDTILRFVIESTRPQFCSPGLNIHNTIALSFMKEMENNISNKDLAKVLAKELITLELSFDEDAPLKNDLKSCCTKLLTCGLDSKAATCISNFMNYLDGNYLASTQNPSTIEETNLSNVEETIEPTENIDKTNTISAEVVAENESQKIVENSQTTETEQTNTNSNTDTNDNETVINEPVINEPVINEPVINEPVINEPVINEPVINETVDNNASTINESTINASPINASPINASPINASTINEQSINQDATLITTQQTNDNHSVVETSPPLKSTTPTTFGKNNTTDVRYLRKSLNTRNVNSEGSPCRPAKIRIEARIQADVKGIEEISPDSNDESQEEEDNLINQIHREIHNNSNKRNTTNKNKRKDIIINENDLDDLCSPLVVTDDEESLPSTINSRYKNGLHNNDKNKTMDTTILNDTNDSEVVPPSPDTIIPMTRGKKAQKNNKTLSVLPTPQKSSSPIKNNNSNKKQSVSGKKPEKASKRRNEVTPKSSSKTKTGEQQSTKLMDKSNANEIKSRTNPTITTEENNPNNLKKSNLSTRQIAQETSSRRKSNPVQNNKTETLTKNQKKKLSLKTPVKSQTAKIQNETEKIITLTKSVEKKIMNSEYPRVLVQKTNILTSNVNNIAQTRSATKEKYKLTNIMTRKRVDNIPLIGALLPSESPNKSLKKQKSASTSVAGSPTTNNRKNITDKVSKIPISKNMLLHHSKKPITLITNSSVVNNNQKESNKNATSAAAAAAVSLPKENINQKINNANVTARMKSNSKSNQEHVPPLSSSQTTNGKKVLGSVTNPLSKNKINSSSSGSSRSSSSSQTQNNKNQINTNKNQTKKPTHNIQTKNSRKKT